jgi:hypothetical protein
MIQLFSGRGSGGLPPIHPYILPPFFGLYCHAAPWCTGVLLCAGELLYNAARLSARRSVCIYRGALVYLLECLFMQGVVFIYDAGRCLCMQGALYKQEVAYIQRSVLVYAGDCLYMQTGDYTCRGCLYMQGGACIQGRVLVCAGRTCVCRGVIVPAWHVVYAEGCLYTQVCACTCRRVSACIGMGALVYEERFLYTQRMDCMCTEVLVRTGALYMQVGGCICMGLYMQGGACICSEMLGCAQE